ncbi:MAG: hypothetical protein ACREIW_02780 [Chthoniobacterales bacterium]
MTNSETLREIAHTRAPFSAWLGVVLLFVLFGVLVLAIIGPSPRRDDYEIKRAKARTEKLKTLHEEDAKALTTYGWINKDKGVAHIPIERAMELTVTELAQKKPAPAYAIATPAPQLSPPPVAASPSPAAASPSPAAPSRSPAPRKTP